MIDVFTFKDAIHDNTWKRIDENHPIDIFIGKDGNGRYAFEYSGNFKINKRIRSSKLIDVVHYTNNIGKMFLVFALTDNNCLRQFCAFCNDIVESTISIKGDDNVIYKTICNVFFTWQKMFRVQSSLLSEKEIKGLIGELLFLKNELIPVYGETESILAWTGPESAKKDFSINSTWFEIKSVDCSKNSVTISSMDQLDSDVVGNLIIYRLEKMAPEFNGVSINELTESILAQITLLSNKDIFIDKLLKVKYSFESQYDTLVYAVKDIECYKVTEKFPRLERGKIHHAINSATYELTISDLLDFKI